MASRVRRLASRLRPGRHARALTGERERARAALRKARGDLRRVRARLATSRGRVEALRDKLRTIQDELRASQKSLARATKDLQRAQRTVDHFMAGDQAHQQRLTEGRAALFDYPVRPRPRDFGRPGKTFFEDLLAGADERCAALLRDMQEVLAPLAALSEDETDPTLPYWSNPWLPPLDGITLYGLIASQRPSLYMEVGSGFSTKFARLAVRDHGLDTKIVSIDPQPRAEVDALCDEVVRSPFEDIDLDLLDRLGPGDILFVDNSHRSFTSSDVTVFFTESLPYLRPGLIYGLHDIFIPHDYPAEWNDRFYAEQYLLMSYLVGGAGGDDVLLGTHHLACSPHLMQKLAPALPPIAADLVGGGFWLRRG